MKLPLALLAAAPLDALLAVIVAMITAHGARAAVTIDVVPITINSAAIADPNAGADLSHAHSMQLRVTSEFEIVTFEFHMRLSGASFYQSPFTNHYAPPPAEFYPVFPAAEFDTWFVPNEPFDFSARPGNDYAALYTGGYGAEPSAMHIWGTSVDPSPFNAYPFAQLTLIPTGGAAGPPVAFEWIARFGEQAPGGDFVQHVVTSPGTLGSPFNADVDLDFKVDQGDVDLWRQNAGAAGGLPADVAKYDLDHDGDTDAEDMALFMTHFNSPGGPAEGDFTGNGSINDDDRKLLFHYNLGHKWNPADVDQDLDVDGNDFLLIQRQLGAGFTIPEPASVTAVNVVPEPAASVLLAACAMAALATIRRPH